MQWVAQDSSERYGEIVAHASGALIGLDYDGTLAPLVTEPPEAYIHPSMPGLLRDLCAVVRTVAIVTGRPARQAVALGGLDDIADSCPNLVVLGQYGNETWTSTDRRVISPPPSRGISGFLRDLPAELRRLGVQPWVEEKGIAVALHTRNLPDPVLAYEELLAPMGDLAARHGLIIEPGRLVIEARAPGMDKGLALRRLITADPPEALIFAGDDLGDLPAFAEVSAHNEHDLPGLSICSGSPVEPRVAAAADVIADGPDDVAAFLHRFLRDAAQTVSN